MFNGYVKRKKSCLIKKLEAPPAFSVGGSMLFLQTQGDGTVLRTLKKVSTVSVTKKEQLPTGKLLLAKNMRFLKKILNLDLISLHGFEQFLKGRTFAVHQHTCAIDFGCKPSEDDNGYNKNR